jgi:two-component system NtrC family sensor kinase
MASRRTPPGTPQPRSPGLTPVPRAAAAAARTRMPLATKMILSYLLIITVALVVAGIVGAQVVGRLVVSEAQAAVRTNLNTARAILMDRLDEVYDVVRLTADRFFLREALMARRAGQAAGELRRVRQQEGLDFLTVTDVAGRVLVRTAGTGVTGDSQAHDDVLAAATSRKEPVASVALKSGDDLRAESPVLAERAHITLVDTPKALERAETALTSGMVLKAAAPILDGAGAPIGFLYGGILVNRDTGIVDKVKYTVFQDIEYQGKDIGTATIFLDDVRIATNVLTPDGARAVGTRVAEDVYRRVVLEGEPWIDRAFVVNDWYIAAYEPIRDIAGAIIGMLYVGVLEQKYVDLRRDTTAVFLALALLGGLVSMVLSIHFSRKVSSTVAHLASASKEMAHGNLDVRVEVKTRDELEDLADAFNAMVASLQRREELLKEYSRSKIMESERLAITGQLAAGVAHELNNPLQGIVTYAHLLLERMDPDSPARPSLEKIVTQADRCREIIRRLLDFSRPRAPQMRLASINAVIGECIALVEHQALFHNIRIVRDLQPDLPPLVIDPPQMQEVFMNLLINAAEAMEGTGKVRIATRLDASHNFAEIEVADTGPGIRPEDLTRIFDPFFTTKDDGHGTGLGLTITQSIVQKHRGTISVSSEPGAGATFVIRLPVTTQGDV